MLRTAKYITNDVKHKKKKKRIKMNEVLEQSTQLFSDELVYLSAHIIPWVSQLSQRAPECPFLHKLSFYPPMQ